MQQNQNKAERIGSVVILGVALAFLGASFLIPEPVYKQQLGPDAFPKVIGGLLVILAGIYVFQQFRGGKVVEDEERAAIIGADAKIEDFVDLKTMGVVLGLMVAYALCFEPLGYALTTFLVFTAGCWFLDRKHMLRDTFIAVIASFGLYFIFTMLLRVNIPAGVLKFLGF
jgi:putative tricarboxylic transport membrane protein